LTALSFAFIQADEVNSNERENEAQELQLARCGCRARKAAENDKPAETDQKTDDTMLSYCQRTPREKNQPKLQEDEEDDSSELLAILCDDEKELEVLFACGNCK
jgi:hypothetical protein